MFPDLAVRARGERRRRDLVRDREVLGGLAVVPARPERLGVGLDDLGPLGELRGDEVDRPPSDGGRATPEGEEVLRALRLARRDPLDPLQRADRQRDLVDVVVGERAVLERARPVAGLLQRAVVEGVGVDDDRRPSARRRGSSSAPRFIATSTSGRSPAVRMSWSAKCTWNPETPGSEPAGARISAGCRGRSRSLPRVAVSLVKRSPVSCIPSPESPAKWMMTPSSGLDLVLPITTSVPRRADRAAREQPGVRHRSPSAALCRFSASSPTGGIGSIPASGMRCGERRSTAIRIAYTRRTTYSFARRIDQAARRTTRMPHAAPEENSSSASTSSAHPRKWRSGSPSVHPSTASRVARSEGVRRRHEPPRGGAPPPRPQGLLRNPSPCDESTPIPTPTRRPRAGMR